MTSGDTPNIQDIQKHVRGYIGVFVTLAALTIVTVAISYLHLTPVLAVTVALTIATIKASLVGCYFMHLISEKKLIYAVLGITAVFFVAMMIIILATTNTMFRI